MNRRRVLAGSVLLPFALSAGMGARRAVSEEKLTSFDRNSVKRLARALADKPYRPPDSTLPGSLRDLNYDQYRMIRFRPEQALWRGESLPFEVQFFHRGSFYIDRVDIHEVRDGQSRPIPYSADLFQFGKITPASDGSNLGFAGFRLHAPLNRPDYYDEVGVFLGASYFRAVSKGQTYGLSARGLSIRTGETNGEEFPAFRAFWIEKPLKNTNSIVVHALLDSQSATAAYRFTIRPGDTTIFDVEMTLYPRVDIEHIGIGTLTSMFFFDANDRVGIDDFRPAVHDSDGLAILNGRNEDLWRPLSNPRDLQISVFRDVNMRGFGLYQRERDFQAYQDIESRFENRPSAWVEPIGDTGEGAVHLIEIPTKEEIHDNIVAFWRPSEPTRAKGENTFTYRLHWGGERTKALAEFRKTRVGAGPENTRRFVLDLTGEKLKGLDPQTARAAAITNKGQIRNIVMHANPVSGGWRISFELDPQKSPLAELRAQVFSKDDQPLSEVWLYRWTS